jgi:hypothetical protein
MRSVVYLHKFRNAETQSFLFDYKTPEAGKTKNVRVWQTPSVFWSHGTSIENGEMVQRMQT